MNPQANEGLDLLSTAVIVIDATMHVRYLNPAAENLFRARQMAEHWDEATPVCERTPLRA